MTIPGSANPLLLASAAEAGGYSIDRSLRFNSADSAYLSRTPASAGNRKTWTWAGWVKRSGLGAYKRLLYAESGGSSFYFEFTPTDQLSVYDFTSGYEWENRTTSVYRDTSSWYHIVLALDTAQATASNRVKIYVNGIQVTALATATYPTQNKDSYYNAAGIHAIGATASSGTYVVDAYLADIHFIDGQALTPSSFGEFDTNGIWQPKAYTGSYGTNGFHLDFADNSAATAAALGKDTSGNGNNWTPNNLSVTAGAGNDSLVDSPTNGTASSGGDAGGVVVGNYCTWNPLDNNGTLANGNLDFSNTASFKAARSTFALPTSDKWYAEFTTGTLTNASNGIAFGFANSSADLSGGPSSVNRWTIYADATGYIFSNGSTMSSGLGIFAAGTVLQIAFDGATGKAWVGKNNTWYNSTGGTTGDPAAGTNQTFTLSGTQFLYTLCYANSGVLNAGSRPFAYAAPAGFKSLNTANLPTPTILKGSTVMDVLTWTGTGGNRTLTGLGFSPDLVWGKSRSAAYNHQLYDVIRGAGNANDLSSSLTAAEGSATVAASPYGYLSAFTSDGFTVSNGTDGSLPGAYWNASGTTYAAWCWDAGSSTVTNTQGSITSTVRANASAGFSVVTYTGTGANATVGHGLNVAPSLVIVKCRSAANDWAVYHAANTSDPKTDYLLLNSTAATADDNTYWNDTAPTSTVFSIGTNADVNTSTATYVAYCWAAQVGYSSFGSYTGNGSADGPFVYTNTLPRWIMIKRTDTTSNWTIIDTAREGYNVDNDPLYPNLANAEGTTDLADILSNGFKLRTTDASVNANTETYVYACFASNPFSIARSR